MYVFSLLEAVYSSGVAAIQRKTIPTISVFTAVQHTWPLIQTLSNKQT